MTDPKFKNPEQIKIRVGESPGDTNQDQPQPGDLVVEAVPHSPVPTASTPSTTSDQRQQQATNADDLIDVISNPHAAEHDWVSACNELEKQNQKSKRKYNKKFAIGSPKAAAFAIALLLSATIGSAAYFHWGPFAPSEAEFKPYMITVQHEIKSHWHPPKSETSNHIIMHFKVLKNGEVKDVGFDRMSQISDADAAALKSIVESMPAMPPLPQGSPDSVDISFTFDYNVTHGNNKT
jgi:hypothetical protein